jgi:hypothetical protein
MSNTLSIHFRPVETKITEAQYNAELVLYRIETKVKFFTDPEMTKLAYERDFVFDSVPYNPTWDGILGDIYALITKSI